MAKLTAILLIILGIALIVLRLGFKTVLEKIPFVSQLNIWIIIVIGVILISAGWWMLRSEHPAAKGEVPIYEKKGKEIVGYRKVK